MKETVEQRFLRHARNLFEKGKVEMKMICPHCGHAFDTAANTPLAQSRDKMGLSLRDVAARLGMSAKAVQRMENGEVQPNLPMARKVAKLYETTLEALWPEPEDGVDLPILSEDEYQDDDQTTEAPDPMVFEDEKAPVPDGPDIR